MTSPHATPVPPTYIPMTRAEMDALGWDQLDILLVNGDAYIDHPSFGVALVGRALIAAGFRVGIVAQPDWQTPDAVAQLGRPRLFAGISAGALDSMLAHYTAFRKKRHDDAYTPGGKAGARPNRACLVYTSLVRQAFPGLPVLLGGIEASLRRITHFDFWTDKLRRSILLDSKADAILYGMAEGSIVKLASALAAACSDTEADREALQTVLPTCEGVAYLGHTDDVPASATIEHLPAHDEIVKKPAALMKATCQLESQVHNGSWAVQPVGARHLILTPAPVQSSRGLDQVYALPFTRCAHPSYTEAIPAERMIRFSMTSHRGCAGGCTFCSLALHQGRRICSRSEASLVEEATALTNHAGWDGSITDVGGPSANMWGARCTRSQEVCHRTSCLTPQICPHFEADENGMVRLLARLHDLPHVKHLRIASGVRHDLALRQPRYTRALIENYVGGQLKLAPEHVVASVTRRMRKPPVMAFDQFLQTFDDVCAAQQLRQYVIPYLMSAFPGCTDTDMRQLAAWLHARGWKPQQVQCFIPTPGTVATAMYYAGIDPDGTALPVARTDAERLRQHGILMGTEVEPMAETRPRTHRKPRKRRRR